VTSVTYEVRFTAGAAADVDRILDYISKTYAPDAADEFVDAVQKAVDALETFPERGSVPRELEAFGLREFRQRTMASYRAIYRIVGRTVFIVLIAHERQKLQSLLAHRIVQP